jgi:hypothetical protein
MTLNIGKLRTLTVGPFTPLSVAGERRIWRLVVVVVLWLAARLWNLVVGPVIVAQAQGGLSALHLPLSLARGADLLPQPARVGLEGWILKLGADAIGNRVCGAAHEVRGLALVVAVVE